MKQVSCILILIEKFLNILKKILKAIAQYDFYPENPNEIKIISGEILELINPVWVISIKIVRF